MTDTTRRRQAHLPRILLLAVLAASICATAHGQRERNRSGDVADVTEVFAVEIPVYVHHKGEPVRGLRRENFEVIDGRTKRALTDFEVVDLALTDSGRYWTEHPDEQLALSSRRLFLLFFDLSFSDPTAVTRAREGARALVEKSLHPADLAGVVTWSSTTGLDLVLNFTSDRRQVLEAINDLGVSNPIARRLDPNRILINTFASALAEVGSSQTAGNAQGRGLGLELVLQDLRERETAVRRNQRSQQQNHIMALMAGFRRLSTMLQDVGSQVQVLYLSEGFDSSVLLGNAIDDRERSEELQNAIESGEVWRIDNDERYGNGAALLGVSQAMESLRRSGIVIQAIDIGGLREGGVALGGDGTPQTSGAQSALVKQNSLFILANDTGGEMIRNFNDFGDAMGEVLERTSVTYLLVFQPDDVPHDGSYRKIEVKLKKGPRGARVVHRPGYYAPQPFAARDAERRRVRTGQLLVGGLAGGSITTSALMVPMAPDERPGARLSVVVDVTGSELVAGTDGDVVPTEIYAYAMGEDGTLVDFFAQALGLEARLRPTLESTGLRFRGDLRVPPGAYRLRTLVRNTETGESGLTDQPLLVPDCSTEASVALLVPDSEDWITGERQGESPLEPFVLAERQFLPMPVPWLSTTPRRALLSGCGLREPPSRWGAELIGPNGDRTTVALDVTDSRIEAGAIAVEVAVAVDAPAGPYTLEVVALDSAGSVVTQTRQPVTVKPVNASNGTPSEKPGV